MVRGSRQVAAVTSLRISLAQLFRESFSFFYSPPRDYCEIPDLFKQVALVGIAVRTLVLFVFFSPAPCI